MTAPRWTPGPWRVYERNKYFLQILDQCGRTVVDAVRDMDYDQRLHDMRLIAASPALYAALEHVEWRGHDGCCPACYGEMEHAPLCKLAAALAAARGGQ